MKRKITKELEISIPTLPNFLCVGETECLSISDFSEKELRQIGKEWTDALVRKSKSILKIK